MAIPSQMDLETSTQQERGPSWIMSMVGLTIDFYSYCLRQVSVFSPEALCSNVNLDFNFLVSMVSLATKDVLCLKGFLLFSYIFFITLFFDH